ncbi:MAG: GH1 family beta-glucosidase [Acidobacteriaceae bacterium]|nr:GH1 family beta-glucosidase [Acidobacteriaceae bacterium]
MITRRTFNKLASFASVLASANPAKALLTPEDSRAAHGALFPKGFLWGTATASYQVEGAVNEDGRGPSIWDTFSHTPGKVHGGDTGDIADDFFHRYASDIALMRELGLKTFRFSLSWSRIFPTGSGKPNPKGLDFYNKLIDALLAAGIQPYCTLYHWDLPQPLQDAGGWENRDTALHFADYASYVLPRLSDRVKNFMTMNEIRTFVELGYGIGTHAPGLTVGSKRLAQLNHHAVLGHGLAVQAARAHAKPGTKVGIADNIEATCPILSSPEEIAAARRAMREQNASYLSVILDGRYSDLYLSNLGPNAPHFTDDELRIIHSPMDYVGLNIYQPTWVRAADNRAGYDKVPNPGSYPHMESPWLTFGPEAIYWGPKLVHDLWKPREMFITENGASSADVVAPNGEVYDTDRAMYLRAYLLRLQQAIAEGVPVRGYFLWSLLDNFEWADGYDKRFGVTYVDFATQKRTPKLSSKFYKQVVSTNAVV